jgi:translation initiation factor 2B subunit (eIF-2B alpha/beta/delta family)
MATDNLQRFIDGELAAIRDDHTSGAASLGKRAAFIIQWLWGVADAKAITLDAFHATLLATTRRLATVRAGMAPMAPLAARVAWAVQSTDRAQWLPSIDLACRTFVAAAQSGPRLAREFVTRLHAGERIVTLSRSATVTRALSEAMAHPLPAGEARVGQISILESRPGGEGTDLARELAPLAVQHHAALTLLPDAALMTALADATCCLIGADALLAEGDAVNKVGSHPLALAAQARRIPCYVLADTTKIAPEGWHWQPEAADVAQVVAEPIAGVAIAAPLFERVPLGLLTLITEAGQLDAAAIRARAHKLARGYGMLA